ncbi:MAG: FAD-binding protein [Pseudomonadota bacterium]
MNPQNEAELAEAIAGATGALRIAGGGTRDIGPPVAGEVLATTGLSGVSLYEPGALTLVVGAGTPLSEVEAVLAGDGQRLAFEPMDHRALLGTEGTPTIGGVVAANVSGPRRVQAGACRDFLLGVRLVDGTGQIVQNGGRVMKNVTGYDLVKLMAGAWGTLGVLTELSFKVLAIPETEATLVAEDLDVAAAVAALSTALGSPYDVTGAAHLGADLSGPARTQVRIEGLAGSVAYRQDRLAALLPGFQPVAAEASAALWAEIRDVAPFAGRDGAVWRVSVQPSHAPGLTRVLEAAGLAHKAIYDWGGGLIWILVPETETAGATDVREAVAQLGGHATLIRGRARATVPVFPPEAPAVAALSRGLRQRFDPRGLLNTGLMG